MLMLLSRDVVWDVGLMELEVERFVANLEPNRTVLLFGSGSSLPSGAPSVADLQAHFQRVFGTPFAGYTLAEQSGIIENQTGDRKRLIETLREKFRGLKPAGSILNLPLYDWKSIFTTNYDRVIEESYRRKGRSLKSYESNFDFGSRHDPAALQLFKLHGSIDRDISDGYQARIILTDADYDHTDDYREYLYDRLKGDLAGSTLVIVGHSLADPHVRVIIDRATAINRQSGAGGRIVLFMYERDDGRASLYSGRGLTVVFGGLDDLFAGLARKIVPIPALAPASGDPLDLLTSLRPSTLDTRDAVSSPASNVVNMFNGWPATYADIESGHTFRRDIADRIAHELQLGSKPVAILLGPSGVGKTTAARQILTTLAGANYLTWEHKHDQPFLEEKWHELANWLKSNGRYGCLLIDDAHSELNGINDLMSRLVAADNRHLRLLLVSSSNHWSHRVKAPAFYKFATEYPLSRVHSKEIDRLLDLVEMDTAVKNLVGSSFAGFSRSERRRRLTGRCEADMFVCLKNIFATERFDDIVLREYATLTPELQNVYKIIAALEASGVRVHRQFVIRMLGIPADTIGAVLSQLDGIVNEQTVSEREGVYVWRGRHLVIMGIIAHYKYYAQKSRYELLRQVIDAISPTYDIEMISLRELCNFEGGVTAIADRNKQNILYRQMTSVAPRERVPRHRLIRNLIILGRHAEADVELRLFEKDFRLDGPAARYKIDLLRARATDSPGLMIEDRSTMLTEASEQARGLVARFDLNKAVLSAFCELGLDLIRHGGKSDVFSEALEALRLAAQRTDDPDMARRVSRYTIRLEQVDGESVDDELNPLD